MPVSTVAEAKTQLANGRPNSSGDTQTTQLANDDASAEQERSSAAAGVAGEPAPRDAMPTGAPATTATLNILPAPIQVGASQRDESGSTPAAPINADAQTNPAAQSSDALVVQSADTMDGKLLNVDAVGQADSRQRQGLLRTTKAADRSSGDLFTLNQSTWEPVSATDTAAVVTPHSDASNARKSTQTTTSGEWGLESSDPTVGTSTSDAPDSPGAVAFEAKLSPIPDSLLPTDNAIQQSSQPTDHLTLKQSLVWSSAEPDTVPALNASNPKGGKLFEMDPAPAPASSTMPSLSAPGSNAPQANVSAAARMEPLIETPAPQAASHQSITVKVPGMTNDTGINLRFVDRGGDIHLSVRTANADLAQDLRGGLNDLIGGLAHAGLSAHISSHSADESRSQPDSSDASPDRKGSGQDQGDSQDQGQSSRDSNQSKWMEALDESAPRQIGSITFGKEQSI